MDEACPILFVIEFVNASATTVSTRIVLERGDQNVILMYHPCLTVVWVSWVFYFYGYFRGPTHGPICCRRPALCLSPASGTFSVCTTLGLAPERLRALPCPTP